MTRRILRTLLVLPCVGAALATAACGPASSSPVDGSAPTVPTSTVPSAGISTPPSAGASGIGVPVAGTSTQPVAGSSRGSSGGSSGGSAPTRGASSAGGSCAPGQVRVSLGTVESAKFQRAAPVRFVNRGGRSCTLTGYPRMVFVHNGRTMALTVVHDPTDPAVPIVLTPGSAAEALLIWTAYQGQGTTCTPQPSSVDITAPGGTSAQSVAWPSDPTDGSVCGTTVTVRALTGPVA